MERVKAKFTSDFWKTTEGEIMDVKKEYWYNGEGWYKLIDSSGEIKDLPMIFFDDLSSV